MLQKVLADSSSSVDNICTFPVLSPYLSVGACVVFSLHYFLMSLTGTGIIEEMRKTVKPSNKSEDVNPKKHSRCLQLKVYPVFFSHSEVNTRHTYHMNQFFLLWPTSAIQTHCVCTWSLGVFSSRKKPQSQHGTTNLYSLVFTSFICYFQGFVFLWCYK